MRVPSLWVACVCFTASAAAEANTGALSGAVTAPDGARLPGAVLTFTCQGSAAVTTAASGAHGLYRVGGLSPGVCEVRAEAPGFSAVVVSGVVVAAGSTQSLDIVLELPVVRESLTVVGLAQRDTLEATAIREGGARDVGEALDGMAGVTKLRKGGIANDVVLRGLQSRDLNVLIDGERVYGACPNHMDPPAFHVDFAEVERIEVAKGPFDLRHQGSLGGLVNVVTRRPDVGWRLQPGVSVGTFSQVNPSLTGSYGGGRVSALAGFSHRQSGVYRGGSGRPFTEVTNYRPGAEESDAYRAGTAWGRLAFKPGADDRMELTYTRQEADHVLYPYLMMDAIRDDTDRLGLAYEAGGLSEGRLSLRARAYLTHVSHWMTDEYRSSAAGTPRGYSMGTDARTHTVGGSIEATRGRATAGVEAYRRGWDTVTEMAGSQYLPQHSTPDVVVGGVGAFVEGTQRKGALTLSAGARLDHMQSSADPAKANTDLYFAYNGTRSLERSDTFPSGKLRLSWPAARGLDLSLGVGHAVRVAEANERYFALKRMGTDWVGNPDLTPSRHTGADAVITWDRAGLHLEARAFTGWLDGFVIVREAERRNQVAGVMNPRARSYANVDARLRGGELEAAFGVGGRVFLSGRVSYVHGSQEPRPELGITSTTLAEMPPLAGRLGVRYDDGRFFAAAEGVFAAAQQRVDTDLAEGPTAGYGTANLRAGYRRGRLSLAAGVENLLDRAYVEHLSYQRDPFRSGARVEAPGRSAYVNLSARF